jgi:hypothetical protein
VAADGTVELGRTPERELRQLITQDAHAARSLPETPGVTYRSFGRVAARVTGAGFLRSIVQR